MIERAGALSFIAMMAATPVLAQEFLYMSDPGLCDAPDGVAELLDTTFLTAHSIGNHYFDCKWDEDLAAVVATPKQTMVPHCSIFNAPMAALPMLLSQTIIPRWHSLQTNSLRHRLLYRSNSHSSKRSSF